MAARAHEISLEAGSKMAAAMKDVIGAAAGLTGFAVESARDLVQYMVRRGQMTQDEADKLIREAEEAHGRRNPGAVSKPPAAADHHPARPAPKAPEKAAAGAAAVPTAKPAAAAATTKPAPKPSAARKPAAAKKPAPAKGAVKRTAVAKASAKPAKKK